MTRVWLPGWEWDCCGDPFVLGDRVDFGIASRSPGEWLAEALGSKLVGGVDAVESHHEEEFADRVTGRVTAVYEVVQEHIERRELRRPGHGAPLDAVAPGDGEEWPEIRRELAPGVYVATQPSRYLRVTEPVPGTATLRAVRGVRNVAEEGGISSAAAEGPAEPSVERHILVAVGWLVDVDEEA